MKPIILSCLLTVFCFSFSAAGQGPSKKEVLATQLLDQLDMQKNYDATFDAMPKMMQQQTASQKMTPEQQEKFNQQMQTSMKAAKEAMSWESIKPIFVKIYADNFDEAELAGLIAFYKSPVGQTYIQKQPAIQAATMQAMGQLVPKIQAAVAHSMTQPETSASPAP